MTPEELCSMALAIFEKRYADPTTYHDFDRSDEDFAVLMDAMLEAEWWSPLLSVAHRSEHMDGFSIVSQRWADRTMWLESMSLPRMLSRSRGLIAVVLFGGWPKGRWELAYKHQRATLGAYSVALELDQTPEHRANMELFIASMGVRTPAVVVPEDAVIRIFPEDT